MSLLNLSVETVTSVLKVLPVLFFFLFYSISWSGLLRLTYQWVFHLSSSHSYLVNEFTEPISRDSYFGFTLHSYLVNEFTEPISRDSYFGFTLLPFLFY